MNTLGKLTAIAVAAASPLVLSSCADQEPSNPRQVDSAPVVQVLVQGDAPEQLVLPELYAQTMTRMGREATLKPLEPGIDPVTALSQGHGDVFITCAGTFVERHNEPEAKKLRAKYAEMEGDNSPATLDEKREDAYAALMASLVKDLDATDPSNAVACVDAGTDADVELANNVVPIYRVPLLEREDRQMLNYMSGTLNTADLEELVDKVDGGQSVSQTVSDYLDDNDI